MRTRQQKTNETNPAAELREQKPHADYKDVTVTIPQDDMSARDLLRIIAQALPWWQATAFPSHMILYKEDRPYAHGQIIWPE
jgi:hypothetical protein